jgi:Outer membrane protein transport protein (OMPP1/FadL/TodX)
MKKALLIILISIPLYAQNVNLNINRALYGQQTSAVTARSLSMGGAGLANGNAFLASTLNPALAVNSDGVLSFNAGFRAYNLEEDRAFPYRDNFGGFVDYGSYYFQNNWYGSMYGQIVYAPDVEELMDLRISTGYIPFMDFNYDYYEEVRSSGFGDELLAYNIIGNSGELSAIPLNIAFKPMEQLSVGGGVSLLTGDVNYSERILAKSSRVSDQAMSLKIENVLDGTPTVINLGSSFAVNERLILAATYRLPFSVKTNAKFDQTTVDTAFTFSTKRTVDYPARLGFGLDYRFENVLAAQLMVDYYYEFWSEFKDSWNSNLSFEDTYNFRVGIEHVFFNDVPFRAGLSHGTLREDRSLTQTTFSLGTGFIFKNVSVDFAAGYANNQYTQDDMYDNANYGEQTRVEPDEVNWTQFFGRVDLSYTFK